MQVLFQILSLVVLLGAIAPVAMAGGQMIAAFMLGRHIGFWVLTTLAIMVLLAVSGALALWVVFPLTIGRVSDLFAPLVSALVFLGPAWAVWVWAQRRMVKRADS
jgi:hypothetical protein